MNKTDLARATVEAALRFHALGLHQDFDAEECFAAIVPGEPEPVFGCIMGQAGEEFGLFLLRGHSALADLRRMLIDDMSPEDSMERVRMLSVSITPLGRIPPERRRFLRTAGFKGRRESGAPMFITKNPDRHPREINRTEAETFLYVLSGVLEACRQGTFEPRSILESDSVLTLHLGGKTHSPTVRVDWVAYPTGTESHDVSLLAPSPEVADLPPLPARWLVGLSTLPIGVSGDDRIVRALLVVDEETGLIVTSELLMGTDLDTAGRALFAAMAGENALEVRGVPRAMTITNRPLFDAVASAMAVSGVECAFKSGDHELTAIFEDLTEHLFSERGLEEPPATEELAGWKRAASRLLGRALDLIESRGLVTARARKRYFGTEEAAREFLDGKGDSNPIPAFLEWLIADYRATKRSRTLAEKMLDREMDESERALLVGRTTAVPSFFQIERVEDGGLHLRDVVLECEFFATDRSLAGSAPEGLVLPARLVPAGEFLFPVLLGPGMTPDECDGAWPLLAQLGLDATRDSFRNSAHLMGRLWAWVYAERSR